MSNHKTRLQQLEKKHAPKTTQKIYVAIWDKATRLVKSGTPELIGMTAEQVSEFTKSTRVINVQPVSMQDPNNGM